MGVVTNMVMFVSEFESEFFTFVLCVYVTTGAVRENNVFIYDV